MAIKYAIWLVFCFMSYAAAKKVPANCPCRYTMKAGESYYFQVPVFYPEASKNISIYTKRLMYWNKNKKIRKGVVIYVPCNNVLMKIPTKHLNNAPTCKLFTKKPIKKPIKKPTKALTKTPAKKSIKKPTKTVTTVPIKKPTKKLTTVPTKAPTKKPTTNSPTKKPTKQPTKAPTNAPTPKPTNAPAPKPTNAITNEVISLLIRVSANRVSWYDSVNMPRQVEISDITQKDINGYYGGCVYSHMFHKHDGQKVTSITKDKSHPCFGVFVNHYQDSAENSARHQGIYSHFEFLGSHHAIFASKTKYIINSVPVISTLKIFIANGRNHITMAYTQCSLGNNADDLIADTRSPYGNIDFGGTDTERITKIEFGTDHMFVTNNGYNGDYDNADSGWSNINSNSVPYMSASKNSVDAQMGYVSTQTQKQNPGGNTNGENDQTYGYAGKSGLKMPINWALAYQFNQYENSPTNSKMAWQTNIGRITGVGCYSHSVTAVLGEASLEPVHEEVNEIKSLQDVVVTTGNGLQVVQKGTVGVARDDQMNYAPQGYNHIYKLWSFIITDDSVDQYVMSFTLPQGTLKNPVFVFGNWPSANAPLAVYVDNTIMQIDSDVLISILLQDQWPAFGENRLYITLMRTIKATQNITMSIVIRQTPSPPVVDKRYPANCPCYYTMQSNESYYFQVPVFYPEVLHDASLQLTYMKELILWNNNKNVKTGVVIYVPCSNMLSQKPTAPVSNAPVCNLASSSSGGLFAIGNKLRDYRGQTVRLHGVNIPSLEWSNGDPADGSKPNPCFSGQNIMDSVKKAIEDWDVNFIRLPISQDRWWNAVDGKGVAYRATVDSIVSYASNKSVYVDIDLHWSDGGIWGRPHKNGQYNMPDDNSIPVLTDLATRYASNPYVILGIYNEPRDVSWDIWLNGGMVNEKRNDYDEQDGKNRMLNYRTPGMQTLVNTVRNAGLKNVVTVSGLDWGFDLRGVANGNAVNDNNVMYEAHVYPNKKDQSWWDENVSIISAKYPILIGEFGASPGSIQETQYTSPQEFLRIVQNWISKNNFSFSAWGIIPGNYLSLTKDWCYNPTNYFGELVIPWLNR